MKQYLVNIVSADDVVTLSVQPIEELDNLYWSDLRTYCSETHNIWEIDGNPVKNLSFNVFAHFQIFSDSPEKQNIQMREWPIRVLEYFGSIRYNSESVFFFSSNNWHVLWDTISSRFTAYFSSLATKLSKMLTFLQEEGI